MEDLKYPIKYALMPVIEQVGWTNGLHEMEREYDAVAYIVSKAYVISKTIKYHSDGTEEYLFNVVFPHTDFSNLDIKTVPKYNINGECINSLEVSEVFDTYEEAAQARIIENRKLRSRCYSVSRAKQFTEELEKYIQVEEFILWNTKDMQVLQTTKLEDLITKVIDNPDLFYEAIALALSPEERMHIMREIKNKVCMTCRNSSCRVENDEKPIENCICWENLSQVGKIKTLGINYNI